MDEMCLKIVGHRIPLPEPWKEYGLSLSLVPDYLDLCGAIKAHWMVAHYLDTHPAVASRYRAGQKAQVRYFDVLAMAEAEGEFPELRGLIDAVRGQLDENHTLALIQAKAMR